METKSVLVITNTGKESTHNIEILVLGKSERIKRGLKGLALCWGLALVSVLLPIAHFVLVPAFFLAGPILFVVVFGKEREVQDGQIDCLNCGSKVEYKKQTERWPLDLACTNCRSILTLKNLSL